MRLRIVLPKVNPEVIEESTRYAYAGCPGQKFHLRQAVTKPLRDTVYHEVVVHPYQCLKCQRTLRVYPQGTTPNQTSQRVKGLAVMLYLLGLSYRATSLALEGLGVYLCKSRIYDAVQETAGSGICNKQLQVAGLALSKRRPYRQGTLHQAVLCYRDPAHALGGFLDQLQ